MFGTLIALGGLGLSAWQGLKGGEKGRDKDSLLNEAIRKMQAKTGDNVWNKMLAEGTGQLAEQKTGAYEDIRGMLGKDPGRLQEAFSDINKNVAREYGALSTRVGAMKQQAEERRSEQLLNIGLALERMDEAKRVRGEDLRTGLIGGGLSLAGAGFGAAAKSKGLDQLLEYFRSQGGGVI